MPFTSIAQSDGWIEGRQGCIIPFGSNNFVFGVGFVVLWSGFRAVTQRSEDMWYGRVLEMVGNVHWRVVELVDGNYPEHRDE
jgi:hypothetical protein